MADAIVAYRYAKSLMDLAKEQNAVEVVNTDMAFCKNVGAENKELVSVLANPIIRHDKKLEILKQVFQNKINPITFSIFTLLTKKNRESLIFPIADQFSKLYETLNGLQRVKITSTTTLTESQKNAFIKEVEGALSKKVILEEKVDETLIGGYVLTIGDQQIDTSVKKHLAELKIQFSKN